MEAALFKKYNTRSSRYTCYPTVPNWKSGGADEVWWLESLNHQLEEKGSRWIGVYIHLPFCDSLCTYCGCNKQITLRHEREEPYIEAVLAEWKMYLSRLNNPPKIKEIHLGGGTPTFFGMKNLTRLIEGLLEVTEGPEEPAFSFEAHPRNTTRKHLEGLYNLGFRRLSLGVQEYDKSIQLAVNRIQPIEWVQRVHEYAKEIGYTSVNHDLIYGLPQQTKTHILNDVEMTSRLMPDRIAWYSYAHVPWRRGVGQKMFEVTDMKQGVEKRALFETAKTALAEFGYEQVGIDHFVQKSDPLFLAKEERRLTRNFNGYAIDKPEVVLGLGVSSISDGGNAYMQNDPNLKNYLESVNNGRFPFTRGHQLSEVDVQIRKSINDLMCYFESDIPEMVLNHHQKEEALREMEEDGLLMLNGTHLSITEEGEAFTRRICSIIDPSVDLSLSTEDAFSEAI